MSSLPHPVPVGPIESTLPQILDELSASVCYILVDQNTAEHCLPKLLQLEDQRIQEAEVFEIPAGEAYKTLQTVEKIWQQLISSRADRNAVFINLGGGVVTDLGGYTAGCYKRGIRFLHIPTTILGMVDAALGGKTGIDFGGIKNSIGLFQMPEAVLTDTSFLATLPQREIISGMAEMYKHALISGEPEWELLKNTQGSLLLQDRADALIAASQHIKLTIVANDPLEQGFRESLNFGHSIGHAIESALLTTDKPALHGEAIAAGMICEAYLSVAKCGLPLLIANEIDAVLRAVYPNLNLSENLLSELPSYLANDKKNRNGKLRMSLLHAIGKPALGIEVDHGEAVETVVNYIRGHSNN